MFKNPFKKPQESEENDTGICGYGDLRREPDGYEREGLRIPRKAFALLLFAALAAVGYFYVYPMARQGAFGEDVAFQAALAEVQGKRVAGEAAGKVQDAVNRPHVLNLAAPEYPPSAQGQTGLVTYRVRYAESGAFAEAKLVSGTGTPALDKAALAAIRQSRLTDPLAVVRKGKRELMITCGFQNGLSECAYR